MKTPIKKKIFYYLGVASIAILSASCKGPSLLHTEENKSVPETYNSAKDTLNSSVVKSRDFFTDPNLILLIDSALKNSQELNIILQEINIARNEVRARKGQYLPFLGIEGGASLDKTGKYTRLGSVDATNDIVPGKKIPEPLPDFLLGARLSWEIDIWKKLRNSKKSAMLRYLATTEGKNFMVTNLVAEVANSYYELIALDNQLEILKRNIEIQQNALQIVRLEKESAKVTELAVRKFEAEVLKNQSKQFYILQQITETENRINFLVGRFPQHVARSSENFTVQIPAVVHVGLPSQLLENRPDIRQAERELAAAKLDVKVAKANFYPSLMLNAGVGFNSFDPQFLFQTPLSLLYSLAGQLVAPLINRNAIQAYYYSASSKQVQVVYNYERSILRAYTEVANQLSNINNLKSSYDLKEQQVQALTQSIDISTNLFKSARADYMEVLLTQRDALESKFELIEIKKQQMHAMVNVYQAIGGGWR